VNFSSSLSVGRLVPKAFRACTLEASFFESLCSFAFASNMESSLKWASGVFVKNSLNLVRVKD